MKETPILFNAPMVRAILAGTKTQTRRVVKGCEFIADTAEGVEPYWRLLDHPRKQMSGGTPMGTHVAALCPHGRPGDRLWVRETWQHSNHPLGPYDEDCMVFYRADFMSDVHGPDGEKSPEGRYRSWRPSIHMPRAASRILLEVTEVRVERLQDISEVEAIAEGIERVEDFFACPCWKAYDEPEGSDVVFPDDPIGSYASLWASINGPGSWDANPWVWAVSFSRLP